MTPPSHGGGNGFDSHQAHRRFDLQNRLKMLKNKKGDAMTDWAISLAIFLLYLAWFLLFVRPTLYSEEKPDVASLVMEKFDDYANWQVYEYPIFIRTNYSGMANEPIIVDFGHDFNETNSWMTNKTFFINDGKLFFIQNPLSNTIAYLIRTSETYSPYYEASDLSANSVSASTSGFTAYFSNGLLQSTPKINSFALKINNIPISTATNQFTNQIIAGQYAVTTQAVNSTFYVFKGNPGVYGIISPAMPLPAKLEFNIKGYESYYINAVNSGSVPYPSGCRSFTSDRIIFYSSNSSLLFAFDMPASISFCVQNTTIDVDFEFALSSQMLYKIVEFSESHTNYQKYLTPYIAGFGAREVLEGVSKIKLLNLTVSNYDRIVNSWKVTDFQINAYYAGGNITFGNSPPQSTNIYVNEYRTFIIDKFANMEKVLINIKSWAR